jgi:hypothetical protein
VGPLTAPRGRARASLWVATALACLLATACTGNATSVTRFDDARVVVHLSIEGSGSARTIVARFEPTEEDLHLYGLEMPEGGIDGAGRPTRITLVDPAWRASGHPRASVESQLVPLAGFAEPFPIYPDGPVTIRQDVEPVVGGPAAEAIHVTVTFMACSSAGLCFKPVIAEPLEVASG